MRSDLALAALACAAVPGMKPVAVAGLTVPGEEEADLQQAVVEDATGRRWLVRSPLSAVAGARLRRNDELVRQLSRHVPFKVPAPVGYAALGQDGQAVVYPHVEGMPLDFTHLPAGPGLASAVGRAVAAVHNIPRGVFEEQDVPVFDAHGSRQRLIAQVDRAAETGRVPTGLLARWEEAFDAAPLWQFATVPVHGAFRGSTVLVAFGDEDAASGRVVAVTDWEEAMVADPAVDLADLYVRASPQAWESVLDAYTLARAQRPDPYLHARARLVAETRRLQGLARAVADGDQDLERRAVEALRRMDRLTEDEDSLVPATARGVGSPAAAAAQRPVPPVRAEEPLAPGPGSDHGHDPLGAPTRSEAGDDDGWAGDDEDWTGDGAVWDGDGWDGDGDVTAEVPVGSLASHQQDRGAEAEDAEPHDVEPEGAEPYVAQPHEGESEDAQLREVDLHEDLPQGIDLQEVGPQEGQTAETEAPREVADEGRRHVSEPRAAETEQPRAEESELEDDEERLHELYGMPAPERDDR